MHAPSRENTPAPPAYPIAGSPQELAERRATVQNNLAIATIGGQQTINLIVQPIRQDGMDDMLTLIVFQDIGGIQPVPDLEHAGTVEDTEATTCASSKRNCAQLIRDRLQTTTEELEASNEALKPGNEYRLTAARAPSIPVAPFYFPFPSSAAVFAIFAHFTFPFLKRSLR